MNGQKYRLAWIDPLDIGLGFRPGQFFELIEVESDLGKFKRWESPDTSIYFFYMAQMEKV